MRIMLNVDLRLSGLYLDGGVVGDICCSDKQSGKAGDAELHLPLTEDENKTTWMFGPMGRHQWSTLSNENAIGEARAPLGT